MSLDILHWNDVYRVSAQKLSPTSPETIDVTQFAAMLDDIRDHWTVVDGQKQGLVLFSGDVFSPSVESSVTRGSHMVKSDVLADDPTLISDHHRTQVPVMNELAPDVSLTGRFKFILRNKRLLYYYLASLQVTMTLTLVSRSSTSSARNDVTPYIDQATLTWSS